MKIDLRIVGSVAGVLLAGVIVIGGVALADSPGTSTSHSPAAPPVTSAPTQSHTPPPVVAAVKSSKAAPVRHRSVSPSKRSVVAPKEHSVTNQPAADETTSAVLPTLPPPVEPDPNPYMQIPPGGVPLAPVGASSTAAASPEPSAS